MKILKLFISLTSENVTTMGYDAEDGPSGACERYLVTTTEPLNNTIRRFCASENIYPGNYDVWFRGSQLVTPGTTLMWFYFNGLYLGGGWEFVLSRKPVPYPYQPPSETSQCIIGFLPDVVPE